MPLFIGAERFKTRAVRFQYNVMRELVYSGQRDLDSFHRHSVEQAAGRFEKFTSTVGGFCMCSVPFL